MSEMLMLFFRGTPSDFTIKSFGVIHLVFLAIAVLGVYLLIENREKLISSTKLQKILTYTLLMQQLILYGWYLSSGYFTIQESLPFYNCRIAILSIVIGELLNIDKIKYIGVYWGFMGSIIALLNPVLDPFGIDHYTFYSFFIGHIFLLWGSLYILLIEDKKISKKSFKYIVSFSNIYHILILSFNNKYDANYCYLKESPILTEMASRIPEFLYGVIIILLFDLFLYLTHLFLKRIYLKYRYI